MDDNIFGLKKPQVRHSALDLKTEQHNQRKIEIVPGSHRRDQIRILNDRFDLKVRKSIMLEAQGQPQKFSFRELFRDHHQYSFYDHDSDLQAREVLNRLTRFCLDELDYAATSKDFLDMLYGLNSPQGAQRIRQPIPNIATKLIITSLAKLMEVYFQILENFLDITPEEGLKQL